MKGMIAQANSVTIPLADESLQYLSGQYLRELALPRAERKNTQAALMELPLFAES